jgi:biopolymer transport protein ExbB
MFEGKTILEILQMGGFTMYVLVFCSILSLAVILERVVYFNRGTKIRRIPFMDKIRDSLEKRNLNDALSICESVKNPFSRVVRSGLSKYGKNEKKITGAMERQISVEVNDLERFTNILGTIGSTVVYIGLFGTVIGIIRAFQDIALTSGGGGGIGTVITGIAEALVSTAAGISVAVPSVIAYNMLTKRIDNITVDMELCASETMDLVRDE